MIFGWDIGDVLYDNAKYTGWHTGYPDAVACVDLSTYRLIPWEPGTAFFLMDLRAKRRRPLAHRSAAVLRNVLNRAESAGYHAKFAAEYEFWFFRETPQSLREKRFRGADAAQPRDVSATACCALRRIPRWCSI